MALLDQFRIEALPKKWADEGKLWQETYFPEMPTVFDRPNWDRYYPETPMPRLSVIMAKRDGFAGFAQKVVGNTAATGDLSGRLWTADKMPDAQFVLTLDETFDKARWGRHWATETMEELFAMKPGEHVLDAFNIEFKSLMDSATFMSFIDRVGKFQLEMQHHFLYGPMALSMPWMRFLEESYHLAAGETLMKAIAVAGILDGGNFGIEDLQQTLNMWYPRGLEMFGSELGGDLVKGVFKTLKNGEAQTIYIDEVRGKVRDVNVAIIQAKARCNREEAEAILRRVTEKGEDGHGLSKEDLVFLPDRRFFRIRGLAEFGDYRMAGSDAAGVGYVYLPYDVHGNVLTEGGKPIDPPAYVNYLRTVLPDRYMRSRHWDFVKEEFLFNEKWGTPEVVRRG